MGFGNTIWQGLFGLFVVVRQSAQGGAWLATTANPKPLGIGFLIGHMATFFLWQGVFYSYIKKPMPSLAPTVAACAYGL